jgi:hypothetical protein
MRLGRSFRSKKEKIFFVVTFGNLSFHLSFTIIKCKRQWTNKQFTWHISSDSIWPYTNGQTYPVTLEFHPEWISNFRGYESLWARAILPRTYRVRFIRPWVDYTFEYIKCVSTHQVAFKHNKCVTTHQVACERNKCVTTHPVASFARI